MTKYELAVNFCEEFGNDYKNHYGKTGQCILHHGLTIVENNYVKYGYTVQFDSCTLEVTETDIIFDPSCCEDEFLISTIAAAIKADETSVKARLENIKLV